MNRILKLFRKEKKKICPNCGGKLIDTGNVADISYFCKRCGLMTYNFYKYEGEFKERANIVKL